MDTGDYEGAVRTLQQAKELALRLQDENGYFVVLASLGLGAAQLQTGALQEAQQNLSKVVENKDRVGRNLVTRAEGWLAIAYAKEGRGEEGVPLIRDALVDDSGGDDGSLVTPLAIATEFYRLAGNTEESLALGERARRIASKRLPPHNWLAARATEQYARALLAAGRAEEARPLLEGAAADFEKVFGGDDARVASLRALLD